MYQIIPWRPKGKRLSDYLAFNLMLDDSTMLTKNGELVSSMEFKPLDLYTSMPIERVAHRAAANRVVSTLVGRWCHWIEADSRWSRDYLYSENYQTTAAAAVDVVRSDVFTAPRSQLVKRRFYSLSYAPPVSAGSKVATALEESDPNHRSSEQQAADQLTEFANGRESARYQINTCSLGVRILAGDDLASYLSGCVSTTDQPYVRMPALPCFLGDAFTDQDYKGGRRPVLVGENGDTHIRTLVVKTTPEFSNPAILDCLDTLKMQYRNVVRFIPVTRDVAKKILEGRDSALGVAGQPLHKLAIGKLLGHEVEPSPALVQMMRQMTACQADFGGSDVVFGYFTQSIVLWDNDKHVLQDCINDVTGMLRSQGIKVQAPHAQMSAWLGTIPGHAHSSLSRMFVSSLTQCDFAPFVGPWQGHPIDEHLKGPAIIRGITRNGTALDIALHKPGSDVGHVMFTGEQGGGKSFELCQFSQNFLKYDKGRVRIFERGGALKNVAYINGGVSYSLGDGGAALQPLAFVNEPAARHAVVEWAKLLIKQEGVEHPNSEEIAFAVDAVGRMPQQHRTLSVLAARLQDPAAKRALSTFCRGGSSGDLLDGDSYALNNRPPVIHYDFDKLVTRPTALGPVISCIYNDIVRCYDGTPLLMIFDEAKAWLASEMLSAVLDELVRRSRREMVRMIVCTHSPLDIETSTAGSTIKDAFKTKLSTAMRSALEPGTAAALRLVGYSDAQIEAIAMLRAKEEYAIKTEDAFSIYSLRASKIELSLFGRATAEDRAEMDRLHAKYGGGAEYMWHWLRYCGHDENEIANLQHRIGYECANAA